jgi:hypothetical protein
MTWTPQMTAEMITLPRQEWKWTVIPDGRDLRDPRQLGEKLLKLRDSDEMRGKYSLSEVYDYFFSH